MKANKKDVTKLLKTARGQIDGILNMIEEDKYCIDIVNQILACNAILRKATNQVMHGHIAGCVKDAFSSDEREQEEKIKEILMVMDKLGK